LTTGNCAGTGGGVTGTGTNNRITKFTSTGSTVGDSTITDTAGTVTTSSNLVVQGGSTTIGVANSQAGTLVLADGGSAFSGSVVTTTLGAARTYTLPDAAGTFCLSSGNCLGGGGGGANTALSNLAGVAINTTLLPGSAGTVNLGSGTLPFGDVFLAGTSGTPGTNNFKITGASTSGLQTITLPDASGTVCLQSAAACGFAPSSGSANYIQNQIAGAQAGDFYINGTGRAATLNGTTGINTGAVAGTQRIDASGNLVNIVALTLSGAVSGGTSFTGSGNVNSTGGNIQTNSVDRISNGGNLVNIGTITSGLINSQTISSAANFTGTLTVQGASITSGTTSQQGSIILHDGNGQTATVSVGSALAANTALAIPTAVSASDTFCLLTLANCVGTGGGVSGSGTNNRLAKFTSTGSTIGDSSITDTGYGSKPCYQCGL